jgi:hypothetical protein
VVVSENIFMLRDEAAAVLNDLLSNSSPSNLPETILIINKDDVKDLMMDSDAFVFRKPHVVLYQYFLKTLHLSLTAI